MTQIETQRYDSAIDYVKTHYTPWDGLVGTFKADGRECNAYIPCCSEYAMIYETESGFYIKGARDKQDLAFMWMAQEPAKVMPLRN